MKFELCSVDILTILGRHESGCIRRIIGGVLIVAAVMADRPTQAALQAHWRFDEPAGSVASDSTGTYPATLSATGAEFVTGGVAGGAIQFSRAANGHAVVGNVFPMIDRSYSISMWIKVPVGDETPTAGLFTKHRPGNNNGYYVVLNANASTVHCYSGVGQFINSTNQVNDGNWHHLVLSHEEGAQTKLYVDGTPAKTAVPSGDILASPAVAVIGGIDSGTPAGTYNGLIDDLQVYDVALSDQDVDFLRNNPGLALGASLTQLLAHLRFDETGGTVASDATGSYPATLSSTGAQFVEGGVSGGAIQFARAQNGYAVIGNVLPMIDMSHSISMWFKVPAGDQSQAASLFAKHRPGNNNGYYMVLNNNNAAISCYSGVGQFAESTGQVNDGNWHHIVLSHEEGAQTKLYVDGGPAKATVPAGNVLPSPAVVMIGGLDGGTPSGTYNGLIDDLQIYEGAVRDQDVNFLFANPGVPLLGPDPLRIIPDGGTFTNSVQVTLFSSVPGAEIRYTLDGSAPTAGSTLYTGPITLTQTATVQALLFLNGFPASQVESATFTADPGLSFSPPGGLFTNQVAVTISSRLAGVTVRYTTNNTEPTLTSPAYASPVILTEARVLKARAFLNDFPVTEVITGDYNRVYAFDDDGIPAAWREQYFGPDYLTDPRAAADADPDDDGWDNLVEHQAGTHPLDSASGPQIVSVIKAIPLISWNTFPGLAYRVLRKDQAGAPQWTEVLPPTTATTTTMEFIDEDAPVTAIYLIELVDAP